MITIIGVGALGSHVALFLRNEKSGMRLFDFDRVEMKNTQAQFHSTMSLGKNKALALRQSLQGLFGAKFIEPCPVRISENNAEMLKDSELVIDCTDNIASREIISRACKKYQLPLLHGALAASGDFARVMWDEHFTAEAEKGENATCVDGEHLPFHALVGSFLALEAQNFLKTGKRRSWQVTPSGIIRLA